MHTFKKIFACCLTVLSLSAAAAEFTLSSPTIAPGSTLTSAQVFNGFGCAGQNISPALVWQGVPAGAMSFAVTVFDPDAPTGSGWWHWVVVNLPATTSGLVEGAGSPVKASLPEGAVQVRTDYSQPGFGGACPPIGDRPHRYIFTVYALKTAKLDLPENASAALAGFMIHANEIGKASFTAYYGR